MKTDTLLHRTLAPGLVLLTLLLATTMRAADKPREPATVDPRDYGAKADGQTLDSPAIQAAIDACAKAGGGTVRLHGGVFLSGTLRLKSNVTLAIEAGATLRGSANSDDYESITPNIDYLYKPRFTKSLIYAEGQENIALVGRGVIDGQGKLFPAKKGDDAKRPYLIRFAECRNVRVRDLTMRDSARWLSHYLACEDVVIDGITIHSRIRENRDGIDVDSCDRVRIANCDIFSGDDAIVLKSTVAGRPCKRVTVTNCTLSSSAAALKLGTESQGGFEDITFDNCVVYDTGGTGICIGEVDGGACARVNVSNIVMRNVNVAIFVRLGNRATPIPGMEKPGVGSMRDVSISNIQGSGIGRIGCSVTGIPDHALENVTLSNIRLRFAGGGTAKDAARAIPEKETGYPNGNLFGTLPAYGFFCRHVTGLRLRDVDLIYEGDEARPAVVADDVHNLDVAGLRAWGEPAALPATAPSATAPAAAGATGVPAPPAAPTRVRGVVDPVLRLHNVRAALIHGCAPWGFEAKKPEMFMQVSGERSTKIALRGNDLGSVRRPVSIGAEVPAEAVSQESTR